MRAAGKTISAESLSCASPGDDDDDDDAESIEDDAGGPDARRKRKERKEQREVARLRRLAEKAALRRTGPSAEELRTQKIAEKVAARRAAKAAAESKGKETKDANNPKEGVAGSTASEPQQKIVTASQADGSDPATKKLEQGGQDVKQHSRDGKQDKVANTSNPNQSSQSTNSNGDNSTSDAPSGKATKAKRDAGEAAKATNSKGANKKSDAPSGKETISKRDAGEAAKAKSEGRDEKKRKGNDASPPRKEHRHDRRHSSRERRSDQTSRSTRGGRHGRSRDRNDSRDRGRKDDRARRDRQRSRSARSPRNREHGKIAEPKKNSQAEQEKDDQKDAPCEDEKEGESSSSSSSSSDSSAEEEQEEPVTCFAWEKGSMIAPSDPMYNMMASGSVSPLAAEVEQFLCIATVDGEAAQRLRVLPAHFQRIVMERGPIAGTTNPTAILMARIRDAELGKTAPGMQGALPHNLPASSNPEIEKMITKWNLDYKASSMLRMVPDDKHDVVLAIPIEKARNPSAFVITQINSLFGGLQGLQDLNKIISLKAGGSDATVRTMAMTNKKKKDPLFMETAVML